MKKLYGDIFFDGWLPKNCGECPFNYDTISCQVVSTETEEEKKELANCLNSSYYHIIKDAITDRRFSGCPLIDLRKKNNSKRKK